MFWLLGLLCLSLVWWGYLDFLLFGFGLRGGVVVVGDFCFVLWAGGCGMVWGALSFFVLC